MTYMLIALALILLTIFIVAYRLARKHGTTFGEEVIGICEVAVERVSKKEENKGRVLALLRERGEVNNADIRDALGFSRTSSVRYMDELEKEGRVAQVGVVGRSVTYKLL